MSTINPAAISAAPVTTRNTVQTPISDNGVASLEFFLHWFWNETDHGEFNNIIMDMLADYLAHPDKSPHITRKPEDVCRFVSDLICMNKTLSEVMNDEKPWNWVDTANGYELPVANPDRHE